MRNGEARDEGKQRLPKQEKRELPPAAPPGEQPQEIKELFSALPQEEKRRLISVLQAKSEIFQGPFPHPKHVAEYEKYCPDFLQRSLTMAENAQAANIENSRLKLQNERFALENGQREIDVHKQHDRLDSRDTARAQYLGFAALIVLAMSATFLAFYDHEKIAVALFSAAVVAVLGKIFVGKFTQFKKRS